MTNLQWSTKFFGPMAALDRDGVGFGLRRPRHEVARLAWPEQCLTALELGHLPSRPAPLLRLAKHPPEPPSLIDPAAGAATKLTARHPAGAGFTWNGANMAGSPKTIEARLGLLGEAIRRSPHNLVSRRAKEELDERHIPECAAFAAILPEDGPVLDLGSGGGLPGVVIAVTRPDLEVHLLEATGKKVAFLREMATTLGVALEVHQGRAEELAKPPLARRFPIVTARAVAPLERLVVWAEPYLGPTGELYAIKGERWAGELDQASSRMADLALTVRSDPSRDPQLGPSSADPLRPRVVIIARQP